MAAFFLWAAFLAGGGCFLFSSRVLAEGAVFCLWQNVDPGVPVFLLHIFVALSEVCHEEADRKVWAAADLLQHQAWSL